MTSIKGGECKMVCVDLLTTVSPEGIASYAHMILVEGIHRDYLPSVVR